MMKFKILTLASLTVVLSSAFADVDFKGEIYPLDGKKEILFRVERKETHEKGNKVVSHEKFTDPTGQIVEEETTEFDGGGKLTKHSLIAHQTNESGSVTIEGKEIVFRYTRNGKEKESREDFRENFVVSPTIIPYMQSHWDSLVKGETVGIRYGALDRRETVGFDLFKEGETTLNGRKQIVIKMKPTSFIIAAIVNPLHFYMDVETKRLTELKGRTAPKIKKDDSWKDLDADIFYTYQ